MRQRHRQVKSSDVQDLAVDLRRVIEGEVRFDAGSRAMYSTAGSNYRQVPIGVVVPRSVADVVETVALCRRFGVPVLARGGGTSLAGQCCNVAVVIDMSKYLYQVLEVDAGARRARVQPGAVLDDLRTQAERHHLTFGPDPATHSHCTLGGMIGNNSCGVHSVMSGKTVDNIEALDILTYDGVRMRVGPTTDAEIDQVVRGGGRRGEIYARLRALATGHADLIRQRFPGIPRRVSGYNLDELLPERGFNVARALVGTEGTCALVLEAVTRLVKSPPARSLLVLGFEDVFIAADQVPEIMRFSPIALEGLDDLLVADMKRKGLLVDRLHLLPNGKGWLLVEFGGDSKEESHDGARRLMDTLGGRPGAPAMELYDDPAQARLVWMIRESGLGATSFVPGKKMAWEGWEDAAVPPERLGSYLRDFRSLLDEYGYTGDLYGHFGHGCVHTRIDFDLTTEPGIRRFRSFIEHAADLVVSYGGSLSGEHGDGQSRAELLPKMFGPDLVRAFEAFKAIWDPDWKMNPGKVVRPYRADENLRLGAGWQAADPRTHFRFPDDQGTFGLAALRCVGVGKCRQMAKGTMCPSYMVTREEMHSTRGRAHLLFELLRGDVISGWQDAHVKAALELCLACKGCKRDCPVSVDMATYKAEFLAHYYERRRRPRHAYAFGWIYWWARAASYAPRLVNLATQTPGLRELAKLVAGMPPQRRIPAFARRTFTDTFARRPVADPSRKAVLLWPDTFNNHFFPGTLHAAVEVLEDAGYRVLTPDRPLCCGRPLYDYGMLGQAKRRLVEIMDSTEGDLARGIPIVGLEPSCVSVFRDEAVNLFAGDERAKRLKDRTFTLAEFLATDARYIPPPLDRQAVVHAHCHHRAIMQTTSDESLLKALGLHYELLDSGCCGMAGSFGFERDKYDVSVQVGERVLLPAVRQASRDTIVIADGFSCREQIAQLTDRRALHLAEVLQMAIHERRSGRGRGPSGGGRQQGPALAGPSA